jgi:all-trans-retinol 13,14-reductase
MEADYLVVGSGLAALAFSTLAARAGKRVCMLEAHDAPGGYAHTFSYGKAPERYRFNAQLHYVWNCGPGETVDSFLRKVGLRDGIHFERFDPLGFDRMRMPGFALDVPNDWGLLAERLAALFPARAKACGAFVEETRALSEELMGLPPSPMGWRDLLRVPRFGRVLRWRKATLGQAFQAFELPSAARTLLALQWPDFLAPPGQLSFLAWTSLFAGYVRGAYYPRRHFEHVVDSMVETLRSCGGQVLLQHRVREFELQDGRVAGVVAELVDPDGVPTGEVRRIRGRELICNMDPQQAAELIGLEHFSRSVRRRLRYDYSASSFMAYLVVEGDLRAQGFGRSNLFHTEDGDLDACFARMLRGDYSRPSFAMTVPSLLTEDRSDCPPGKQIVELLTVADYQRFLGLKLGKAKAYGASKRSIYEQLVRVIERHYVPDFGDRVVFKLLGSPTTNQRFCLAPRGNSYGSTMSPSNIAIGRLGWESSIPGLHFCNASSGFAGFAGTIWTGSRLWEALSGEQVLSGPHTVDRLA